MSISHVTVPELFFIKYKGIPAPWEFVEQAKRLGFKCKKYANWKEVHVSENSRKILKETGDSLIDSSEINTAYYPELSQVWEKVQRWTKDKESFSLEPDLLSDFEVLARLISVGANSPNVVDLVLEESGLDINSISIEKRWLLFLADCLSKYFQAKKRFQNITPTINDLELENSSQSTFINQIAEFLTALYLEAGFDTSSFTSEQVLDLFIRELGLPSEPTVTKRDAGSKSKSMPKVWVEKFEGSPLELVKFKYSDGAVFVRVNRLNRVLSSDSEIGKLLSNDDYWLTVGKSIESHISQIDEIQDFFNTFARNLRTLA